MKQQADVFKLGNYTKNIKMLQKRHPEIYKKIAENKEIIPYPLELYLNAYGQINGYVRSNNDETIHFYREGDILKETEDTIKAYQMGINDVFICIGIGLGYTPLIAAEHLKNNTKLLVIEPSIPLFKNALHTLNLENLLNYPMLELQLGDDINVDEIVKKYKREMYVGSVRRLTHIPSRIIFGGKLLALEKEINEKITVEIMNWNTIRNHGKNIFTNSLENLMSLFSGASLSDIKNRFHNMPVVCVASGPSLEVNLPMLKKIEKDVLILACDSAIKPLLQYGITPHIISVVDHNLFDFEKIRTSSGKLRNAKLVFFTEANSDSVRGFLGQDRVGVSAKSAIIDNWLGSELSINCQLGGHISSNTDAAVLTAIYLGASPIILVGVDLAFTGGHDHATGVVFQNAVYDDNMLTVEGVRGIPVRSPHAMIAGRVILEKTIAASGKRFIDSSMNGALIKGTEVKTLEELYETEICPKKINVDKILNAVNWSTKVNWFRVINIFEKLVSKLQGFKNKLIEEIANTDEILYKINKQQLHWNWLKQNTKKSMEAYRQIISSYGNILDLLNFTRFKEQLDVDRKIANLGSGDDCSKIDISKEALEILKEYFCSLIDTLDFFAPFVEEKIDYFKKMNFFEKHIAQYPEENSYKLRFARIHAKKGQLWLAEKWYMEYMGKEHNDVEPYIELAESYIQMKLWKEAQKLITKGLYRFPSNLELHELEQNLETETKKLLMSAKEFFCQYKNGDLNEWQSARRSLIDYMELFSYDEEALSLEEKIDQLDNDRVESFNQNFNILNYEDQVTKLEQKAKWFIAAANYEHAAGIYYGLKEKFPDKANEYYRKTGDIRFGQKDYASALWNYNMALSCSTQKNKHDLKSRVQFVMPLIEAKKLNLNVSTNLMSVIIPIENDSDKIMRALQNLGNLLDENTEILIVVGNNNHKKICQLFGIDNSERKMGIRIVKSKEGNTSVSAVNEALMLGCGETFVLINEVEEIELLGLSELFEYAREMKTHGLVELRHKLMPGQYNKHQHKDPPFIPYPMKTCKGLISLIPREVLRKTGVLDVNLADIRDALEDLRIRSEIDGYENIVIEGNLTLKDSTTSHSYENIKEKWVNGNLPEFLMKKKNLSELFRKSDEIAQKGDIDKSINLLVTEISKYPNDARIYLMISKLLLREERFEEAMGTLKSIPEPAVKNEISDGNRFLMSSDLIFAKCHLSLTDVNAAKPYVDRMLDQEPNNVEALCCAARIEAIGERFDSALKIYKRALKLSRMCGQVWLNYGQLMVDSKENRRSFDFFESAFRISPIDPGIMTTYYSEAVKEGVIQRAVDNFKEAVTLYPYNKRLSYLLIDLLLKNQEHENAMALIELAMAKFGTKDGIVDHALSIRKHVNALIEKSGESPINDQYKSAVLKITSEIKGLEKYLFHMKDNFDAILLHHNGRAPESVRIAEVYGVYPDRQKNSRKNFLKADAVEIDQGYILDWIENKQSESNNRLLFE